jgi:hypothetical protein
MLSRRLHLTSATKTALDDMSDVPTPKKLDVYYMLSLVDRQSCRSANTRPPKHVGPLHLHYEVQKHKHTTAGIR